MQTDTPEDPARGAVTDYVRAYFRKQKDDGLSYAAIAEPFGVSPQWVMYLLNPKKYGARTVGRELEQAIADELFEGRVDELRRVALTKAGLPERAAGAGVVGGIRAPRDQAVEALATAGEMSRVDALSTAEEIDDGRPHPMLWWLDGIRSVVRARQFQAHDSVAPDVGPASTRAGGDSGSRSRIKARKRGKRGI